MNIKKIIKNLAKDKKFLTVLFISLWLYLFFYEVCKILTILAYIVIGGYLFYKRVIQKKKLTQENYKKEIKKDFRKIKKILYSKLKKLWK